MAETGWPLIPREMLPAPVPAARPKRRRPIRPVDVPHADAPQAEGQHVDAPQAEGQHVDAPQAEGQHLDGPDGQHADGPQTTAGRQLSIFGAETTEPSPADLIGLLAGPGQLGRMGGTARVSIRVDAAWRVHVLVNELVRRGLVVTWLPVEPHPITIEINNQPLDSTAHQLPNAGTTSDQHTDPPEAPDYDDEPASAVIGGTAHHAEAGALESGDGTVPPVPRRALPRTNSPSDKAPEEATYRAENVNGAESSITGVEGRGLIYESTAAAATPDETAGAGASTDSDVKAVDQAAGAIDSRPAGGDGDAPADRGAGAAGGSVGGGVALFEVRTAYSSRLNGLARSWPTAAHQLFLSGPRLRLWVAAAGRPLDGGYALGLDPRDDPARVDAALVRAGLAGAVSDDGRYYLILGRRRLGRLAELVGERPAEAPASLWPSGVAA